MKNTYIIAVKDWFEPVLITQQPNNDITYIGKHYKHAYIMESKQKAQETRGRRYKQREERKNDANYSWMYF